MTSLSREKWAAQALYEELYYERGNMENRITEQFSLFADRVSAETIRTNQLRLYLSAVGYILVSGLRRVGLKGTDLAPAQVCTIRTKLLKLGAQIRISVRKVWVPMASSYPWQDLYRQVWLNLRCREANSGIRHLQLAHAGMPGPNQCAATAPQCHLCQPKTRVRTQHMPQNGLQFFIRS